MVVIEEFNSIALDVICPDCSLGEGLGFAIGEGVESDDELIEFVSGVEVVEIGEVIPGNLRGEHVAFVPPCIGEDLE